VYYEEFDVIDVVYTLSKYYNFTLAGHKSRRVLSLEVIPIEAESLYQAVEETEGTRGDLLEL
jgi:hypothetical protein